VLYSALSVPALEAWADGVGVRVASRAACRASSCTSGNSLTELGDGFGSEAAEGVIPASPL